MLPLDGYVRVSRVGARDKSDGFISPEIQERAIRDCAARSGVEVVIQPHELNVSGGTMDRPVFNTIMERIRRGESGGIIVYKTDRFARTLLGAVTTLAELGRHNAAFVSATEPTLDYASPAGRAFLHTMFVFAEFLRSTLKESWATAQRHAIEQGIHISPNGFLGYDRVNRRLVPNEEAAVVQQVFQRRGTGEAWGSLADWLNEVAAKPDGTVWTGQAVQRMCAKRVYRGEASRYVAQDVDGRGAIVNPDAHPALVSEAEWQAAQMNPRLATGGGHRDGTPYPLLTGLIRCAGCRYSMSLGRGPKGEPLYRCRGKHASGTCPQPAAILAEVIEHHVQESVLSEIEGTTRAVPDTAERDRAAAELEQAREDLEGFRRDRAARRKLGADWHDWLDDYLRAVRDAETALERIDARISVACEGVTREHFLELPVDDRRDVLAGFIDVVFVRRSRGRGRNTDPIEDRTRILWRGQAPDDLPRKRVVNAIVAFDFEDEVVAGVAPAQDGA